MTIAIDTMRLEGVCDAGIMESDPDYSSFAVFDYFLSQTEAPSPQNSQLERYTHLTVNDGQIYSFEWEKFGDSYKLKVSEYQSPNVVWSTYSEGELKVVSGHDQRGSKHLGISVQTNNESLNAQATFWSTFIKRQLPPVVSFRQEEGQFIVGEHPTVPLINIKGKGTYTLIIIPEIESLGPHGHARYKIHSAQLKFMRELTP